MLEEKLYSIHAIHTGERKRLKKKAEDTRYRELEDKVLRNRGKIQT